jgi:hypothetical protein
MHMHRCLRSLVYALAGPLSRAHVGSSKGVSKRIIALPSVPDGRPRPQPWPRSFNHATARQSLRARNASGGFTLLNRTSRSHGTQQLLVRTVGAL